ncbi:MAG TPA: ATP synthase F1 subunit gamma [Planctomycetota bacterium]|nr:ATP synthase F1 subunit gamma [Planctomycetota bacterium]
MASIRDLRVRIKSVGNIKQITRAMEMVATTKLRRFQDRAIASRPYANEIAQLLSRIATAMGPELADQAAFRPGKGQAVAVLLVTSERGLCGAYNSNVYQALERWLRSHPGVDARFFVYGRKGYQYAQKRGFKVERFFVEPPLEKVDYRLAKSTARALSDAFASGTYKEVVVLYSAFESMAKYVPTFTTILPVQKSEAGPEKSAGDVILEPDVATLLEKLVPRYLETRVYNALLESITSEYASRRMSMKNATDAASTMQSELKGIYNRKRQEGITKDLLDIVGAAEALR